MATSTDMKGNVVKMEVDYSDTVDKRIPECEAIAAVSYSWVSLPWTTCENNFSCARDELSYEISKKPSDLVGTFDVRHKLKT